MEFFFTEKNVDIFIPHHISSAIFYSRFFYSLTFLKPNSIRITAVKIIDSAHVFYIPELVFLL